MSRTLQASRVGRLRSVVLGVAALLLGGCATGYTFVQPDAGGGYYTGAGPYASSGYYDDVGYGADAWYPGYAGFGYNPYYYGSSISFGLGIGSMCGWGCGSYYGGWPWFYGGAGYPYWGYYRHGRHHRHHGGHDPVAGTPSPRPWRQPDHPRVPPAMTHGATPPIAVPERPREGFANRRPLDSARFAPHEFTRAVRPMGVPARPVSAMPQAPAFAERPAPRFAEPPMRVAPIRSAPAHNFAPSRPVFAPPPAPVRNSSTPATKIR